MTEYVVLMRNDVNGAAEYTTIMRATARSATAAIRQFVEERPQNDGGEFVAVPARSWRPVTVKVETKTALRFS